MPRATQANRQAKLFVPSLGTDVLLLRRMRFTEMLGRPYTISIEALSERDDLTAEEVLGVSAYVELNVTESVKRNFHGYIVSLAQTGFDSDLLRYQLTIAPYLWLLSRHTDCRIFQNQTVPEIIKQVCADAGYTDIDDAGLSATYNPWEYCVQYRESDLNFISRLMEQEGIYYWLESATDKEVLKLADSPAAHAPQTDLATMPFRGRTRGGTIPNSVTAWRTSKTLQPGAYAQIDYNPLTPRTDLFAPYQQPKGHAHDALEIFEFPGEYLLPADGSRLSTIRLQELHAGYERCDGETNARDLRAGRTFTLEDFPREDQNREYLVTTLNVDVDNDDYLPSSRGTMKFNCSFTAIDAQTQFRSPRSTAKPVVQGPQTAFVVAPNDEEIQADEHARVRVKFHWDRHGDPTQGDTSCWIRVAQVWAGKKWGAQFMPRSGQEVIVEFLEGDPDRPIITGRVYNGEAKPPYDPKGADSKTMSTIKSLSSPDGGGFNELRFQDKKDHEQILLHAQKRMDHVVLANLYERVGGSREVRIGYEESGDHNTLIHRDINHRLKGGHYDLVDKKLHENVKDEVVQVFEKTQTTVVTDRATLNAKEIVLEGQQLVSIKADKFVAQGAQSASVKAGSVKIEGTQNIHLKCGASFISITPSGVYISGPTLFLNSGGAATPAEAPATAQDPTLEEPLEAASATAADPGQRTGYAGGAPRTRTSRTVPIRRAPEPPPPPPPRPTPRPDNRERRFVSIEWVEPETWCGEPATLRGTTSGYTDGEAEAAQVRNVIDGATIAGINLAITSNAFSQPIEVKDWLPRRSGSDYEIHRDEDGFAAGMKTPRPIKMNFIPNLTRTECAIGIAHFFMTVTNFEAKVEGAITYVKGWIQFLIALGNTVPAATGGNAGVNFGPANPATFSGSDWRFAKNDTSSPTGMSYWDGTAWQSVPATWTDPNNVRLYPIGIWREGTSNKAQFGNNWPETVPAWGAPENSTRSSTLPTWISNINSTWTHKFDLKRHGCASSDKSCCRYTVKATVSFTEVASRSGKTIVLAANNARSNAGAWSLGDNRPGMPPHEFGHHLGNPDEYAGGVGVDASLNSDGATAGIDPNSIMGTGLNMNGVKKRHMNTICQHMANMVSTQKGKSFTYDAIAHT